MTGIYNNGNASLPASDYAVMMDQVIMRMQYVGPVDPQLLGHLPRGAKVWPRGFLE
jgi:hypothetical protein